MYAVLTLQTIYTKHDFWHMTAPTGSPILSLRQCGGPLTMGLAMIVERASIFYRVLLAIGYRMGPFFPLWIERTRVGENVVDYVYIGFRRPR